MDERHRLRLARVGVLITALVVLGVIVWQVTQMRTAPTTTATITINPSAQPATTITSGKLTRPPADRETPLPTVDTDAFDLTPTALSSPADRWAQLLLGQLLPIIRDAKPASGDFAWWQNSEQHSQLSLEGGDLAFDNGRLPIDELQTLDIYAPDPAAPNLLNRHASITWSGEALRLALMANEPGGINSHWLLSSGNIALPLESLVQQAAMQKLTLIAAYADLPGQGGQLILIQALSRAEMVTPTATTTLTPTAGPSPTVTLTPLPSATATPTREPTIYLRHTVAEIIDPIITAIEGIDRDSAIAYLNEYPISGILSWSETGATIDDVAIAMEEATEVNFYHLRPADEGGGTERFLQVQYKLGFTRLLEADEAVWGQRIEEVLYWMIQSAANRGGQLYAIYEDFGSKQSVTVVYFQPTGTNRP